MVLKVYNTMSKKLEVFNPISGNRVKMFVCGPTTYDLSHLGHARTYISYDIIARYLKFKGYSLFYIMNITDVDDKIINKAREIDADPLELVREYERYFYEDIFALGIQSVSLFVRASEHVPEIINQVKTLIDKKFAYETESGVYYDVTRFKDFGVLSRQKLELGRHRIDPDPTKRNAQDFALWKKKGPSELGWSSPWGRGRPGWHIEDTAITTQYFGPQYDVHGGAIELIFPHHEAEIAQAESATGIKPLVKYWLHTGVLKVNGKKMSKSLGNFLTIRDTLRRYDSEVLRFLFASTHYRSDIDFNERHLEQAKQSLQKLRNVLSNIQELAISSEIDRNEDLERKVMLCQQSFLNAMDHDFNSPLALKSLFEMANEVNRFIDHFDRHAAINKDSFEMVVNTFKELGGIFNILQKEERTTDSKIIDELVNMLIELREGLRENEDWQMSDKIRARLREIGIILEDLSDGTKWTIAG